MALNRNHFFNRSLAAFTLFALAIIFIFNLYVFQDTREDYETNQSNTANSIITALEAKIELPLLVADNEAIQDELSNLNLNDDILYLEIKDNKNSLVASRLIGDYSIDDTVNLQFTEKDILNEINVNEFEEIFSEDSSQIESQKVGSIKIFMKPFEFLEIYRNSNLIFSYNVILISLLIFTALFLARHINFRKTQVTQISNFLSGNKIEYFEPSKSKELNELYHKAANAIDRISKQNIQLANLKQEIQYAREDSNMELHKFLEFLIHSERIQFDQDLKIFSESVLINKNSEQSLVNIGRSLRTAIAIHSDLCAENNVVIYDNILNKLQDFSIFIDKDLFHQFLNLYIGEMIKLCRNSELNINADINKLQDESNILRLSFESSSPAFSKALELQSLFDFVPNSQITISENNSSFIACKHLVQKTGGDYIFLKDEIRFEFPVLIEKNYVSSSNLSFIKPLEQQRELLVYDSDPTERIVLMGYLDKFGQSLDKATTKQVVLQKLRHNTYDVLCVNSDFFSDQDPYFLTNFKTEYLDLEKPPLLLVISSNSKIIKNDYFKPFNAKHISKPIDLKRLEKLLINLT